MVIKFICCLCETLQIKIWESNWHSAVCRNSKRLACKSREVTFFLRTAFTSLTKSSLRLGLEGSGLMQIALDRAPLSIDNICAFNLLDKNMFLHITKFQIINLTVTYPFLEQPFAGLMSLLDSTILKCKESKHLFSWLNLRK